MKKLIMAAAIVAFSATAASAYYIGGQYATLISCDWGKWGYQYGYIATYKTTSGDIYRVFSGNNYCQY